MSIKKQQMQILDLTIDVIKKDIKNMHLAVYPPNGRIRLAAPTHTNEEAIRLFAVSKVRWIRAHQKQFNEQLRESPKEYIDGESHYFNGTRYLLKVIERQGKHEVKVKNKSYLELYIKPETNIKGKERVFREFYREHLKNTLPILIEKWEEKTGKTCEEWEVRRMRTKWGSFIEEKNKIIFNLELAKKSNHCIEYIVAHEFMHFFERNHNRNFVLLMDKYMPNWRTYKRELNEITGV